jgi:hypothetical protein
MRDFRPSTRLLSKADVANIEEVSQPLKTSSLMQFLSLVAAIAGGAFLLYSVRKIKLSDILASIKGESKPLLDEIEPVISSAQTPTIKGNREQSYVPSKVRMRNVRLSSEEVAAASQVESSGVTVGSFGRGGISESLESRIREKAKQYGLNPEDMLRIIAVESGGNPNAISSTGAVGLGQFTARTAKAMGLRNRFDPEENLDATMRLAVENKKYLINKGVDSKYANDPVFLYLSHQIGSANTLNVIRAYDSDSNYKISYLPADTQYAISVNIGGKAETVGQYIDANRKALKTSYAPASSVIAKSTTQPALVSNNPTTPAPSEKTQASTAASSKPASSRLPASTSVQKKPQDIVQTSTGHLVAIH